MRNISSNKGYKSCFEFKKKLAIVAKDLKYNIIQINT